MCLDSSPDLLVSYLAHLDSRGLSEHYTFKINEYIGKYLRNFKEVSTKSVDSSFDDATFEHSMTSTSTSLASTYLTGTTPLSTLLSSTSRTVISTAPLKLVTRKELQIAKKGPLFIGGILPLAGAVINTGVNVGVGV